jgi:hypothetical protein
MIIAVTEAMERAPEHCPRLVEAAAPRDWAPLDLGDCQVRAIFRIATLRPISNTKTAPAADFAVAGEYHARPPVAARADHPHATHPKVQGCGRELNSSGYVEAMAGGQFHLE